MLEKLQIIQQRFDEVSDLIIQPDIIADQKRYVQLNKEYKDLSLMVEKIKSYKTLLSNLEEAEQLLKDENDEEMLAMAKQNLEVSQKGLEVGHKTLDATQANARELKEVKSMVAIMGEDKIELQKQKAQRLDII